MELFKIKRVAGIIILLLGVFAICCIPLSKTDAEEPVYTVILDPGHGGEDGGAVADDGTVEKDLNLLLALSLKEKLKKENVNVIMTREADDDTDGMLGFHKRQDLESRADLGNGSGASVYVSIHINASQSRTDQGFQVLYGSGNERGESFAATVTRSVRDANICTRIRTVKRVPDTLYIFRTVKIPSILVECGFISNASDLRLLKDEAFRENLTTALCEGIVAYLSGSNSEIT